VKPDYGILMLLLFWYWPSKWHLDAAVFDPLL
jgi:hypothetical protein